MRATRHPRASQSDTGNRADHRRYRRGDRIGQRADDSHGEAGHRRHGGRTAPPQSDAARAAAARRATVRASYRRSDLDEWTDPAMARCGRAANATEYPDTDAAAASSDGAGLDPVISARGRRINVELPDDWYS